MNAQRPSQAICNRQVEVKPAELSANEIAEIGFIAYGSLGQISARCGKPNCRCKADPPQLHGPYWQWSTSKGGKTTSKRLNDYQAGLYQEWIDNRRRLETLIERMKTLSSKVINEEIEKAATKRQ